MLYTSADDFYKQISNLKRLSREEEKELAKKMKDGNEDAKKALRDGYLPTVGALIKRYTRTPSLDMIYRGIHVLETSLLTFNFQYDDSLNPNCAFVHVLSERIRKMMVRYIVDNPIK